MRKKPGYCFLNQQPEKLIKSGDAGIGMQISDQWALPSVGYTPFLPRLLSHLSALLLTPAKQPMYCAWRTPEAPISGSLPWLLSPSGRDALPPDSHGSLLFLTFKMLTQGWLLSEAFTDPLPKIPRTLPYPPWSLSSVSDLKHT